MDSQIYQLLASKRRIAYLITNQQLRITDTGGDTRLITIGSSSQNQYKSLLGRSLLELVPELIENGSAIRKILEGQETEYCLQFVNREQTNEKTSYLNMTTTARRDRAGQIVGLVLLVEDVTDMGVLKQQIEQLHNNLDLLQYQLDMAAHELGTPLTLISGYLDLLQETGTTGLDEEQNRCLELVISNAEHLVVVVNDLLDMVYAEAGRLRLALQPVDLSQLVHIVSAEFSPKLTSKSQELFLDLEDDLPHAYCDMTRVIQIVSNLLDNASRFSPPGSTIKLSISREANEDSVRIAIQDRGKEIILEDREMIFQRYYRTKFADQYSHNAGAGLGLYISRLLVELHNGRIWCDSPSGQGNIFNFTLPTTTLSAKSIASARAKALQAKDHSQKPSTTPKSKTAHTPEPTYPRTTLGPTRVGFTGH